MAKKNPPTDGLGKREIAKIRSALRLVWSRCEARRLVVKRCTGSEGFFECEDCDERTPRICIDHVIPCGDVDGGYIARLFVSSSGLQALCPSCHKDKTNAEKKERKERK